MITLVSFGQASLPGVFPTPLTCRSVLVLPPRVLNTLKISWELYWSEIIRFSCNLKERFNFFPHYLQHLFLEIMLLQLISPVTAQSFPTKHVAISSRNLLTKPPLLRFQVTTLPYFQVLLGFLLFAKYSWDFVYYSKSLQTYRGYPDRTFICRQHLFSPKFFLLISESSNSRISQGG